VMQATCGLARQVSHLIIRLVFHTVCLDGTIERVALAIWPAYNRANELYRTRGRISVATN
jgi:hypothetical protein